MKVPVRTLTIAVGLSLLIGCGGGGNDGGGSCTTDAECDDGTFCNGLEQCSDGTCRAGTSPCYDGNNCTDDVCTEFVRTCRNPCNASGTGDPCCNNEQCADDPKCGFTGGTFLFRVVAIRQDPPACVLLQSIVDEILLPLIQITQYPVYLPPDDEYPADIELPPIFGDVTVPADFVDNEIVFDSVEVPGFDLGPYGIPLLNCLVGGTAEGQTEGLSSFAVPLTIHVYDMSVTGGGGTGPCVLPDPGDTCTLYVDMQGVPPPT